MKRPETEEQASSSQSSFTTALAIKFDENDSFWRLKRTFKPKQRLWAHVVVACAIAWYLFYESTLSLWISGGALVCALIAYSLLTVNKLTLRKGVLTKYTRGEETKTLDLRKAYYYRFFRASQSNDQLALYDANDVELVQLDMDRFDLSPILAWATRSLEQRSVNEFGLRSPR